jgi:translation initiation factor 6 (eIF-6)
MSTKYKNISEMEQTIIGVGVVKAGQEFISSQEIINPNIQVVGEAETKQPEQPPVDEPKAEVQA